MMMMVMMVMMMIMTMMIEVDIFELTHEHQERPCQLHVPPVIAKFAGHHPSGPVLLHIHCRQLTWPVYSSCCIFIAGSSVILKPTYNSAIQHFPS
jgi:hypothetical protein